MSYTFLVNNEVISNLNNPQFIRSIPDYKLKKISDLSPYAVQSKVSTENFRVFVNFLNDNADLPEINADNYFDFFLLQSEFNTNSLDFLYNHEYDEIRMQSVIEKINSTSIFGRSICEKLISANLEYMIDHFEAQLHQVNVVSLYNIFFNEERRLFNHEKAYQFIKSGIENDNGLRKNELCILLTSLDGK